MSGVVSRTIAASPVPTANRCAYHDGFFFADRNGVVVQNHLAAFSVGSKTAAQFDKRIRFKNEAMFQARGNRVGRVNRQPEEQNSGSSARNLSWVLSVRHLRSR